MKVGIIITDSFAKDTKRLRKKYPSIRKDIEHLQNDLAKNPNTGIVLRENISKIRMPIRSKGRGKSGGARVIAYHEVLVRVAQHKIYLIALYDKSEQQSISDSKIQKLLIQNDLG